MPNFDQKIFWFPESYNELRKELVKFWPELWEQRRCQWAMAFDADIFIEFMNEKLDGVYNVAIVTNDDHLRMDHICTIFLTELRKRRGELNP